MGSAVSIVRSNRQDERTVQTNLERVAVGFYNLWLSVMDELRTQKHLRGSGGYGVSEHCCGMRDELKIINTILRDPYELEAFFSSDAPEYDNFIDVISDYRRIMEKRDSKNE